MKWIKIMSRWNYFIYFDVSVDRVGPLQFEDAPSLLAVLVRDLLLQDAEIFGRGAVECRVGTEFDVPCRTNKTIPLSPLYSRLDGPTPSSPPTSGRPGIWLAPITQGRAMCYQMSISTSHELICIL